MDSQEQKPKQDKVPHTIPYRFKKGISGNPGGRPKGAKSMKTWAREYLESLSEDERVAFINANPTALVWQMAEGNPDNKQEIKHDIGTNFTPEEIEAAKQIIIKRLNAKDEETIK